MTRSRNASGFYFCRMINYFNSYLVIRQENISAKLKIGVDILRKVWYYIDTESEVTTMDYEEMILAAQEERDEYYDENEEIHEVYNPIIRQMMIEAGMKVN